MPVVMPPSMWLTQAAPSRRIAALVDLPERRIVLVAEIAAHLREVLVAGRAAVLEIGRPLAMIVAVTVIPVIVVSGGNRAGAHEDDEEQRVNELPGHWLLLRERWAATVHAPVRTCQSSGRREFVAVALSLPVAGLTLTYWFVHCRSESHTCGRPWRTDIDSILGGDVMTIRKPVVSQAAWVIASMASTSALGQTAPEASAEAVEVEEIVVTGSRIARSDFSSTSPIVTVRRRSHRAERHGQHRTGDEPVAAVRAGPDLEHRRRRGARGTRVAQPAWSRRNTKSRAARRAAPAAVQRECGGRRQPDSAVHPERRRDDHRRRFRRVRLRRHVRRRQLQEHHRLHRPASSTCARA